MSEITDEILNHPPQKRVDGFSFLQTLFLAGIVLAAAIFVGDMLFGKNSWQVLVSLKKQQRILDRKIDKISKENANLQKQYFELKSLMPEDDDRKRR